MPKIIENVRENIILEGRKVLIEKSYKDLNIRDIAKNCSIGIGTFYNYFSNKESLVVEIFRDDWKKSLDSIEQQKESREYLKEKLRLIYLSLENFITKYMSIFYEISMVNGYKGSHCNEFQDIYKKMEEFIDKEKELGTINCDLNSYKLAQLILSNFIYLSRNKYMTFDELYEVLNI